METTVFENINGKGFIRIDGKVKCKYCEKIENVTLQEINYFEVREESEESLRNKIEMLCKEYFRKRMEYLNEHEERCEHKNRNILRMGECKIAAYRNNQKIYEQTEYRN
ncbi:uncharacterized protein OCT59_026589 [Rhizophagus irregularis]|uniref:uncharacterized protein n=1 Tax=Rhizophagus irregularis TaxID=588596 RepID=UPI0019FB135E|nr:hypothetical protein OCT59_026589 [Rhizophagus irregularis]GET50148.1 hypothetical protein RIR_jg32527.t1 [Rhizophagus irregularis DAOM 181602=DAOM 197198]